MKKIVGLMLLVISMATTVYADMPQLVVYFDIDESINSLQIFSTSEWNRDDLNEQKVKELSDADIFCSSSSAYEAVREIKIGGTDVTVKLQFPAQQGGRDLNETTRFELSLYEGERLFFHSTNFGQLSEEFTTMPESGVKFRPQTLSLFVLGDQLQVKVSGVYGESAFENEVEIEKGLTFTRAIKDTLIDDQLMNSLATQLQQ